MFWRRNAGGFRSKEEKQIQRVSQAFLKENLKIN